MKRIFSFNIAALLMMILILSACNLPKSQKTAVPTGDPIGTAAAQTVSALSTQLGSQVTVSPTAGVAETLTPPAPTNTPASFIETIARSATALPCDRGEFVSDVTVPDGTSIGPGQSFTKTWRLKNTGSCTWTNNYRVVFDSGNALGAPASFNLPASVAPNSTIDISVNMKAPDSPKSYESNWKLQNSSGVTFGLGANGEKSFWVKIAVGSTASPFAVTTVKYSVDNANVSAACPFSFKVTADITTSAAGRVTYYWERSDGTKTDTKEVNFDQAGTRNVTYEFQLTSGFDGWVRLYNDNPNHQNFSNFGLKLSCNP